jgi:predicted SprT family Zn-dependent metalloprotease
MNPSTEQSSTVHRSILQQMKKPISIDNFKFKCTRCGKNPLDQKLFTYGNKGVEHKTMMCGGCGRKLKKNN